MPKKLLESEFLNVDLQAILSNSVETNKADPKTNKTNSSDNVASSTKSNNAEAEADSDFKAKLQKLGFSEEIINKLVGLGELFKKSCEIIGFSIENKLGGNPILAFMHQQYVQTNLLSSGSLNRSTFKAIYNAVAKHLIADSEFFTQRDYNILYCTDLYNKSPKEMEDYLKYQSLILNPKNSSYSGEIQLKNRKLFLQSEGGQPPAVFKAKLKDLDEIKEANGDRASGEENTAKIGEAGLKEIAEKLDSFPKKFAAILSLSTNSQSEKAKQALNSSGLNNIKMSGKDITQAFLSLSTNKILPKGQMQAKEADALVDLIIASLER
jgi:hypothetical protein